MTPLTKRRPVVAKRATTATPREIATRLVYKWEGPRMYVAAADLHSLIARITRAIRAERSGKGRGR